MPPLRRVKVRRPPAPWMQSCVIQELKIKRDTLRAEAHATNTAKSWNALRQVRYRIKSEIGKAKRRFVTKSLLSKRPKEVWRVIHRILNPSHKTIQADPGKLNQFFITTSHRTLGSKSDADAVGNLTRLVQSLQEHTTQGHTFNLQQVTVREVEQEIDRLRNDTSTGVDRIPAKFLKFAKQDIAGPLTHIINTCIRNSYFPETWKTARVSPIPKVNQPSCDSDFRPISILPAMSKVFERLVLNQLFKYIDDQALLCSTISEFERDIQR
ncbi:Hypothetical predicted protein [Paramuricea clavata]|uniref:Uncharacterized protein n=1 Tax=Paramuricea clavata TaxID=317549 RepID=A0A7D9DZ27_PARCT|nr:Hypothetical predicted protein [Paramuricea clavata]